MQTLNLETANRIAELAIEKANSIGIAVCIAVVDGGGHLYSSQRMDGAFLGSIDVAYKKARTSVLFPMPTGLFGEVVRAEHLTGMELSNQGLICFPGGLPIRRDGKQLGAIGISGGTAAQDMEVAEFAVVGAGFTA
ncbi:MAG: heme-binding protein [Gammaproteobacteria bacterium]|nr:heme-binding protein [Gammaproteobacteria bacterium]